MPEILTRKGTQHADQIGQRQPEFSHAGHPEKSGDGHADEAETDMTMATTSEQRYVEPIIPPADLDHPEEKDVHTDLRRYGACPENAT